ncbi:hypothetical protein ABFS82_05G000700 [Erythranthe guttata]|uniref:Uncharacterized protein n=1 Tax=Erythranthe guttata TaxID=4155 RepID=A0A022RPZ9_ERYGU|nr:hypothetical protein MIMGU_mgv1a016449mg [Erythranthe guttata]
MMTRQDESNEDDDYVGGSKIVDEVSALVLNIIRSPAPGAVIRRRRRSLDLSGFACLLMGICLSMMLCGSVTFFIGLVLMPWILFLVMLLYFVGVVSSISMICTSIFMSSSNSSTKHYWKFL